MRLMKTLAATLFAAALPCLAAAQSNPGLTKGQVLTAGQWNALFVGKQDTLGFTPLNTAGGVMLGRLVTAPPGASTSGLNLTCGSTPASPANGDEWCTSLGLFVRINGVTVGPLSGASGGSFAGTSPIGVTFPAGVVTYAFDFTVANTFLAQQTGQGATTTSPGWYTQITGDTVPRVRVGLNATDIPSLAFGPGSGNRDLFLERLGPASWRLGAPDAAAPVAQTLGVQNVVAGTSNTAGAAFTITGSRGTGTGAGGAVIFQTAPAGSTGSSQNALATALTIFGSGGLGSGAATDQGAGTLNLAGSLFNNGTAPTGTGAYVRAASPTLSGTPVFPTNNFISLSSIVQDATAWSLLGNATGGTANYAPFTIGGLTNKTTPAGSDFLLLQDQAAGGALKFCTVAQCIGALASGVSSLNTATGNVTLLTEAQGRLTLQLNTPVMSTSQTAQTTLRYDCVKGSGSVPYYTGSADAMDTIASCEVTDAMVSAASAGQVVSGQVYDAWWVHSGANRICLAMSSAAGGGGGWASDTGGTPTSRGTGYTQIDSTTRPYATNKNAIANCFNGSTNYGSVSANQATYLGTVLASANGQISWTLGSAAAGGGASQLGVWNMYNRVDVRTTVTDSTASWSFSGGIRNADNSANNRHTFVMGLPEESVAVAITATIANSANAGSGGAIGFGLDATASDKSGTATAPTTTVIDMVVGSQNTYNALSGLHFVQATESALNGFAVTVNGNSSWSFSLQMRM